MIAIIILTHDEREKLATHLPSLLSQRGVDYEVIVVDMYSEDDTTVLLQTMEEEYHHLRHLSLPANAKNISYERLALHLGMRAAIASRVMLMDADTEVPSEHWLADVQQMWRPVSRMIIIPTVRTRTNGLNDYFNAGHESWCNRLLLSQSKHYGLFKAGNAIVGMDKEIFLHYNAPARFLALKTGTMDIFVAHTAGRYQLLVVADQTFFPCRDANLNRHFWSQRRLFNVETSRHMPQRHLRVLTYLLHCVCTIHRGSILYGLQDIYDNIRWCFTDKKAFIKRHY